MKSVSSSERDWMWLPDVALASILSHLDNPQSYVRFSVVCKQWHSVVKDLIRHHIFSTENQVPFLLLGNTEIGSHDQRLYSVTQGKLLDLKLRIPSYVTKRCCGSSHGWLAYVREDDVRNIVLYNPFTHATIPLPPITTDTCSFQFDETRGLLFIDKLILSADPSRTDYIVAARISNHSQGMLALIRPGRDEKWTLRLVFGFDNRDIWFEWLYGNIMFDKSRRWVYTMGKGGMLLRSDLDVMETVVQPLKNNTSNLRPNYLVETTTSNRNNGDVLMISIVGIDGVKVFKLQDSSFVEVDDLNGDAVFLGYKHSSVVAAGDFPSIEAKSICNCSGFLDSIGKINYIYTSCGFLGSIGHIKVRGKRVGNHYVPYQEQHFWITPTISL